MVAAPQDQSGLLLAAALAVAVLAVRPPAVAQSTPSQPRTEVTDEVIISAKREADAVLAEKVTEVLARDPYMFSDHISVEVERGTVTLRGVVEDLDDLRRALILARRMAGGRRVLNRIEFIPADDDHD